jgi:SMI1 / KNR4 family (SUKH-1)
MSDETMETAIGHRLLVRWNGIGVKTGPRIGREAIAAWEAAAGVSLTNAMRDYFCVANGMEEGAMDPENYVRFWTLAELKQEPSPSPSANGGSDALWLFADYSISALEYAIDLGKSERNGQVVALGGLQTHHVAESFEEFVRHYLANSDALYGER